jgi:hypothetical protein
LNVGNKLIKNRITDNITLISNADLPQKSAKGETDGQKITV